MIQRDQYFVSDDDRIPGTDIYFARACLSRPAGPVQVGTHFSVDPCHVRIWRGNARKSDYLNENNVSDLIESMKVAGGQKVPAWIRPVHDDPHVDYEVIAGARRHFAVSYLRANGFPEMEFTAQIVNVSDEDAFLLSDLENRARADISDLERARNYLDALHTFFEGKQKTMADRLGLSTSWLSKQLTVAMIPDEIIAAFASPADVQIKPAYRLAKSLRADAQVEVIKSEAVTVAREQQRRKDLGQAPLTSGAVLKRLLGGSEDFIPSAQQTYVSRCNAKPMITVEDQNRRGIVLKIHGGSGAKLDEICETLRTLVSNAQQRGAFSLE
jgi:ParB family chromosome partitioning protein